MSNPNMESTENTDNSLLSIGSKGQVVDGIISQVSDQISINFDGKELEVSKSAVQNAREGEVRQYKIMDISETSIVLKEVGNSSNNNGNSGIIFTTVEASKKAFSDYLTQKASDEKEKKKSDQDLLSDINEFMTGDDYKELSKEGLSLESYEAGRLDRALARIKEQRAWKEQNLEKRVSDQKDDKEEIQKAAIGNMTNGGYSDHITEKLKEADLPITQSNIAKVSNAAQLAKTAGTMSDKAMSYLISKELKPTIQNIYNAQYSGSQITSQGMDAEWEQVKPQAEAIIKKSGMEVNESTMGQAKWLFQNQLPITENTLESLQSLENIKANYNQEDILNKIVGAMADGIAPEQTSLDNSSYEKAEKAVEEFAAVSDAAIIKVAEQNKTMNLSNLKQETVSAENKEQQEKTVITEVGNYDINAIKAKRQLEEIRLKMTVEAGQKLIDKGINLDTSNLEKIVQGLKDLEDQYYRNLLQEGNAAQSDENMNLLRETTEKINDLKGSPSYVLGSTLNQRSIQTVNSLHEAASGVKAQMDKAQMAYDTLGTEPRKDLGDSIQKAFGNIDSILKDLNLEANESNKRAVRILGYNHMEINQESIEKVKAYDTQVRSFINNLHPSVTVQMIKNGTNPLDTPIDELNEQITQMKDDMGITDQEKYSKYLWKLEQQDGITEEERKAYIGIYRLLNNVEKTDGAAIGSVLETGQQMTLKNLLTAVRTSKNGGIDQKVDDNFGALESLTFQKETITDQISVAYQNQSSNSEESSHSNSGRQESRQYYHNRVTEVMDDISPDKLAQVMKGDLDSTLNLSLEKFSEEMAATKENQDKERLYYEQQVNQVRETVMDSDNAVAFLNAFQIPTSIQNLTAAKNLLNSGQSVFQTLHQKAEKYSEEDAKDFEESLNEISESLNDKASMQTAYDKVEENMQKILNKEYGNTAITTKDLAELKQLSGGIELTRQLSNQEYYQIPLVVGDSITNINLTIVSGTGDNGNVQVSLDSEALGKMEADISIKNGAVKGYVLCSSKGGRDTLRSQKEQIEEKMEALGLQVKQLNYGMDQNIKGIRNDSGSLKKEESTDTKTLYQVAKVFIQSIKEAELKE